MLSCACRNTLCGVAAGGLPQANEKPRVGDMRVVYLDWNVIVGFVRAELPASLKERLVALREHGSIAVPYSSAHVEEAERIEAAESEARRVALVAEHLNTLAELSGNRYRRFKSGPGWAPTGGVFVEGTAHPRDFSAVTTGLPGGKRLMKSVTSLLPEELAPMFQCHLGFEPRELNNVHPSEVFAELERRWLAAQTPERSRALLRALERELPGLHALMTMAREGRDDDFVSVSWDDFLSQAVGQTDLTSPQGFAVLMALLDLFGYWPDRRKKGRHGGMGRLWDAHHASMAGLCDYFVSDDSHLRHRSMVVFRWTEAQTETVSTRELPGLLAEWEGQ